MRWGGDYILKFTREPRLIGAKLRTRMSRKITPYFQGTEALARRLEFQIHWVSPNDIRLATDLTVHKLLDRGMVLSGNWDLHTFPFEEEDFHRAYATVLVGGGKWKDTDFYERVLSEIASGQAKWECQTTNEFEARLRFVEVMATEIADTGYIPNHNEDQIAVCIGRHGDLLFNDGQHRLGIAKLFRLPSVPISIVARHRLWHKFKRQIVSYAARHRGRVRDPLPHPDLESIAAEYGHKRFELIRRTMTAQSGRLLDLGCHWGYFCHRFEELGFDCTGVEGVQEDYHFLKKLHRARNRRFGLVNQEPADFILQMSQGRTCRYDVVLALDLFENPARSDRGCRDFLQLSSAILASEMYFLPRSSSGRQCQDVFWEEGEAAFLEFVRECTTYATATCIGHIEDGRPLYHLEK